MKKMLLFIVMIAGMFAYTPLPAAHAADPLGRTCNQLEKDSTISPKKKEALKKSAACDTGDGNPITGVIKNITNVVSAVVGIAAVIMIIVGGISMMLAGGDTQKFANGRNTVLYAVIGIIVVVLAQALVRFILSRVG